MLLLMAVIYSTLGRNSIQPFKQLQRLHKTYLERVLQYSESHGFFLKKRNFQAIFIMQPSKPRMGYSNL